MWKKQTNLTRKLKKYRQRGKDMSNIYSVWFHQIHLSEYIKKQLLILTGSCQKIFEGSIEEYKHWGLSNEAIDRLIDEKLKIRVCEKILRRCEQEEIEAIDFFDVRYPWLLREIPDPPVVLYVKGNVETLKETMIAVVGSRQCSEYGQRMAGELGMHLAESGICVTSGMAMGIDGAAHFGALQNGVTIGILGTGANICYPSCNWKLYQKIIEKGAVVSEYPPDMKAMPYHFPKRNRIISGMSYGVVVVEAAVRSGSLITAQLAMDYDREVYAVPGNAYQKLSQGTNTLIKQGARCIMSAEDIIEVLPDGLRIKCEVIKKNRNKLEDELAQEERIVYASVSQEPIMFEKILESTQLSYERINTTLLELEVKGLIQRLPGERYVRI